jgi:serine/threonine-protein kinase
MNSELEKTQVPTQVPGAVSNGLEDTLRPGSLPHGIPAALAPTAMPSSGMATEPGLAQTVLPEHNRVETLPAPLQLLGGVTPVPPSQAGQTRGNTTVLPHVTQTGLVARQEQRYVPINTLGAGGMGEVVLAEDRDIGRRVAVKHLHAALRDDATVARFIEEVRTVGSLEHPNIVPIHDVGLDEHGRYFFVMKALEGETLEQVIEKLRQGDAFYHSKYTFDARLRIFLSLLRALQYAHSKGFIHRDIKPANLMVGKYGEVVLMDWGIAKSKSKTSPMQQAAKADADKPEVPATGRELYSTRSGALVGTPAYMSPEQARGDVDAIDERSDLYSACVLFHEFVTLRHYLEDEKTMGGMLAKITGPEEAVSSTDMEKMKHPGQTSPPPTEFMHMLRHGTQKDPDKRFRDTYQLIDLVERTLSGEIKVECIVTMNKRMSREMGKFIERHPLGSVGVTIGTLGLFVGSVGFLAFKMLHG